ncbi:MAG: S9 family peptidase [Bacteroides sp.]|nr:S9 family peptidase [Bacteroides sp.]MCM1379145.1 S9 family peptidase [Bacteroides sp.]MCM1445339.1 S9 family peptidase [Prevotella sp.]
MKKVLMATLAAVTLTACSNSKEEEAPIIDKPVFESTDGVFTIEALEALGRVSAPVLSPDKTKLLYSVSYESVEQNASNNDLYLADLANPEAEHVRLTRTAKSEGNAVWLNSGKQIAFLYSDKKGNSQIWVMDTDGSNRTQVTSDEKGINGFVVSPDEKKIVMIQNVKYAQTAQDVYPDLPKANARIIDDMMYKHWDEWVTEIPHPFVGDFDGKSVSNVKDIMADEPYESPVKPFGGVESFAWSPDSKQLVYTSRKKTGMEYAISTNSDLFLYDVEAGTTKLLTEGMYGYDTNPVFSPDGSQLAWLSMERDGYESDKNRIMLMDIASGEKRDLTANWDYTVDDIAWQPSGRGLFFLAYRDGVRPVFSILLDGTISVVAQGEYDYDGLCPLSDSAVVTMRHSMLRPNELFLAENLDVKPLSKVNDDIFAQLTMPTVERRMVPTTDGKEMLTWIVKPQNFDSTKKYPALLYCQGGPQQAVSQFWSYRWNLALMAAHGYVIIAPNRRGLPGFGTEWNEQISGDYPGQNMRDYLAAVDDVKTEPWIDATHIGATGASYGGFSVYWLAGNHDHRFACLIAHAGIFNIESQYLETEEMWFANWDMGGGAQNAPGQASENPTYGAFWNKSNATAQRTFAMSPHRFVDKWDTPILITHGEYDYRILSSQGEMAFNAAKLRGVPAEMVIFPEENHWILKPQNAVLWQRVFFRWLDKWLKPSASNN